MCALLPRLERSMSRLPLHTSKTPGAQGRGELVLQEACDPEAVVDLLAPDFA